MHRPLTMFGLLAFLGAPLALAQGPLPPGQQGVPNDMTHAMAMSAKGTLAIQAVQGTKDGPPVGGEDVEIIIFHRDQPVQQINSKLDDHGLLVVENLPVSLGIRALVRVQHAGVLFQDAGPPMDDANPTGSMNITVYEVSDERQPMDIVVRQLAGALVSNGVDVAETVVVENNGDRTWLGEPADEAGRRATVQLTLPPDAVEVELLQGFHGWCCSQYTPPTLTVQMPIMPGQTTFKFAYKIPVRSGESDLRISSGLPTEHSVFVVPATDLVASGEGAELIGTETISGVQATKYEGGPHAAGDVVGLKLSDVRLPVLEASGRTFAAPPSRDMRWAYWVFGIVAGVGAVVTIGAALRKRRLARE